MSTQKKKPSTKLDSVKKKKFLTAYSECGNITHAAEAAGIERSLHYWWLEKHPRYVEAFEAAHAQAIDRMEQEARRRAMLGVDEPVFYQGIEVARVRKPSDTLLMFMLKGALPDKYRDNVKQEISGPGGGPIRTSSVDLSKLTAEELAALEKVLCR